MKKLKSENNSHLRILYDCMGNQKLQQTICGIKKEVPFYIGQDDKVTIYASGALVEHFEKGKDKIAFVDNNGKVFFDITQSSRELKLSVAVFDTGVLIGEKAKNGEQLLQYYTYQGEIIVDSNAKGLIDKVSEFEQRSGLFLDNDELTLE